MHDASTLDERGMETDTMRPEYITYLFAKDAYERAAAAARAAGMGDYDAAVACADASDDLHRAYMAYVNS